jgi:hypothetical protein
MSVCSLTLGANRCVYSAMQAAKPAHQCICLCECSAEGANLADGIKWHAACNGADLSLLFEGALPLCLRARQQKTSRGHSM